MRNTNKLNGKNIDINEGYCKETTERRKQLSFLNYKSVVVWRIIQALVLYVYLKHGATLLDETRNCNFVLEDYRSVYIKMGVTQRREALYLSSRCFVIQNS